MPGTIRERVKRVLEPVLYRRPVPELPPERLYLFCDALWQSRALPGTVVEVGCFQCGTSAWAFSMLKAIGVNRSYLGIDTFRGFNSEQFLRDAQWGTSPIKARGFQANSRVLVERMLQRWDCSAIQLIEADIVDMPASLLPDRIAVALVDVDIEAPTRAALEKLHPLMVPGGTILVDDCDKDPANPFRGARVAYERFVAEHGLPERYLFGMGCVGALKAGEF